MTHRKLNPALAMISWVVSMVLACLTARAEEAEREPQLMSGELWLPGEDSFVRFRPTGLIQPTLVLRVEPDATDRLEGTGFELSKAEVGIDARVGELVEIALVGALENGEAELADANVLLDPLGGLLAVRAGYFKQPLTRQFNVPDANRQLARDALALDLLEPREEIGIQLEGGVLDFVDYRVGAWIAGDEALADATGASVDPIVGGRIAVHPLGPVGENEEPDLARTPSPRFALGGSVMYDRRGDRVVPLVGIGDVGYSDNRLRFGGELAAKWRGASIAAELFLSRVWVVDETPAEIADRLPRVRGIGGYLQAGYFAIPDRLDIAARFDFVDPDLEIAGWTAHPAVGVGIYALGHMLKLMLMYRLNLPINDPYPIASAYHTPTTHDAFLMLQGAF